MTPIRKRWRVGTRSKRSQHEADTWTVSGCKRILDCKRNSRGGDGVSPLPRRLENAQAVQRDDGKRLGRQATSRRLDPVQRPAASRQRDLHIDLRGRRRRRHCRPARSARRSALAKARSGTKRQRQLPFDGIQTVGRAERPAERRLPSPSPLRSRTTISPATRSPRRLDGKPETGWGVDPEEGKPHAAIFVLKEPLRRPGRTRLTVVLEQQLGRGHLIGRPRTLSDHVCPSESATPTPDGLAAILAIAPSKRTPPQRLALARSLHDWQIGRELAVLPVPHRVYAGCNNFTPDANFHPAIKPRPIFVLRRGDINQPIGRPVRRWLRAGPRVPFQTAGSR